MNNNKIFKCGRFELDYSNPIIMGILNITPDSFSDGGNYFSISNALKHAEEMIRGGADIIDVGAESTRPGSLPISPDEEMRRLMPIVKYLVKYNIPISVDTYRPEIMKAVLDEGVDIINDIYGFSINNSMNVVSSYNCGLCIVHMNGIPNSMQNDVKDVDVISEVRDFFKKKANDCANRNIDLNRLIFDPGIGFGKSIKQNLLLINKLEETRYFDLPILVGLSRKSIIGHFVNKPPSDRLIGSISGMLSAVSHGANVVRVHDVSATVEALKIWLAVNQSV